MSSKVIDLGVDRKPIGAFLIVINGNFESIVYRFRDIGLYSEKTARRCSAVVTMGERTGGLSLWIRPDWLQ